MSAKAKMLKIAGDFGYLGEWPAADLVHRLGPGGYVFRLDPSILINQAQSPGVQSSPSVPRSPSPEENRLAKFLSVVLADTEDT